MLAVSFDAFGHPNFWISVMVVAGTYALFTLGLQLNVGFTGILNFGQAGFMAIGAYTMGLLVIREDWPIWGAMPAATLAAIAAGLIVGIPSLRLRADYFAIATIAFGEIVVYVFENTEFAGGYVGILGYDREWQSVSEWLSERFDSIGLGGQDQLPLLLVVWLTVVLAVLGLRLLQRTPWGRVIRGIREDEDAVRALGKNVFSYKLQSLALAAALASVAGYFLALNVTVIYPVEFESNFTFLGLTILIFGGVGSYLGVAVGSAALWTVLEGTRLMELPLSAERLAALRFIIVGVVLVLFVSLRPQGLLGRKEELRRE
jgi:branched-chain amino acid transport system permease protein